LRLAWKGREEQWRPGTLPPAAARRIAHQDNSSPRPADEHFLLGGRPDVGGSRDHAGMEGEPRVGALTAACSGEEMVMGSQPPLANTVTLGVQDFSLERGFYQRLGWPVVFESDGFTVFQLRGAVLALFQLGQLARDAHAPAGPISAGIRSAVIITVDRPGEVDELASRARAAGATVTKQPTDAEFFQGRDAYFADPEGNYWEIAWAPGTNPVGAAARRAASQPPPQTPPQ